MMKFPLWILVLLISISLVLAGTAAYKLYNAQVIASITPAEALVQAADAVPSAPATHGGFIASGIPRTMPSSNGPLHQEALIGKSVTGPSSDTRAVAQPTEQLLQKIGTIGITAGQITQVALSR